MWKNALILLLSEIEGFEKMSTFKRDFRCNSMSSLTVQLGLHI